MRQAGRYHDHYQNLKKSHDFMELCKDPNLAAEVALGPVADFDFDVSILFSDLLFPLEALGVGLEYSPGPKLDKKLDRSLLSQLRPVSEALEFLKFQKAAVEATRKVLPDNKSLIGFVGGPWTLYCYAVEGSHAGSLVEAKRQPDLYASFAEVMTELLISNIKLQLDGGAELVMIFDTAAGELSAREFNKWCVPHLKRLAAQYPGKLGYYGKATHREHISDPCFSELFAGVGVDHRWNVIDLLKEERFGFVQGNFDQCMLFLPEAGFKATLDDYLKDFDQLNSVQRSRWVCGLGHGVLPKTPQEHVRYFVQRVRQKYS
ncbi:uroporphyrinogen decarboxylase [bacterium]|nr:uroporphyrinogen decarboxylase [bacterium]